LLWRLAFEAARVARRGAFERGEAAGIVVVRHRIGGAEQNRALRQRAIEANGVEDRYCFFHAAPLADRGEDLNEHLICLTMVIRELNARERRVAQTIL